MEQCDLNKAVRGKSLASFINISNEIHMSWRAENFAIFKIYVEIAMFLCFMASCYDANHYSGNLVSVLWQCIKVCGDFIEIQPIFLRFFKGMFIIYNRIFQSIILPGRSKFYSLWAFIF